MPPPGRCGCDSPQPSRGTARARQRGKRGSRFPDEDPTSVSEAAMAAVATGVSNPKRRLEDELDPQIVPKVRTSRNALFALGSDGLRFLRLQSIMRTGFGRDEFDARRIIHDPGAFPPKFWPLVLQSHLTALGELCRPVCVGMACRRLLTAGTMRQWRSRLKEINREVRQLGVGVRGGFEQVALRAKVYHKVKT